MFIFMMGCQPLKMASTHQSERPLRCGSHISISNCSSAIASVVSDTPPNLACACKREGYTMRRHRMFAFCVTVGAPATRLFFVGARSSIGSKITHPTSSRASQLLQPRPPLQCCFLRKQRSISRPATGPNFFFHLKHFRTSHSYIVHMYVPLFSRSSVPSSSM